MNTNSQENHYLELASCLMAEKKFHTAHDVLLKAHKHYRFNPVILYHLGESAVLAEMYGIAELHFQSAIQLLETTGDIALPDGKITLTPQMMEDNISVCRKGASPESLASKEIIQNKLEAMKIRYEYFKHRTIQKLPRSLITAPPVGSYYIVAQTLADRMSTIITSNIRNRIFPGDILQPHNLIQWHSMEGIEYLHIEASNVNLRIIRDCFIDRLTVIVSDPRSLIVDFTRFLSLPIQSPGLLYLLPSIAMPPEFSTHPWTWRVDWVIDHYLPTFFDFYANWIEASETSNLEVHFLDIQNFWLRPKQIMDDQIYAQGIDPEIFAFDETAFYAKSDNGPTCSPAEWALALNETQIDKIEEATSSDKLQRFGWRKYEILEFS